MATLAENAAAVKAAQVAIDAAIVAKGGTTTGGLNNAAQAISAIPSGGGGVDWEVRPWENDGNDHFWVEIDDKLFSRSISMRYFLTPKDGGGIIYWGDGSSTNVTSETSAAVAHTYKSYGVYEIVYENIDLASADISRDVTGINFLIAVRQIEFNNLATLDNGFGFSDFRNLIAIKIGNRLTTISDNKSPFGLDNLRICEVNVEKLTRIKLFDKIVIGSFTEFGVFESLTSNPNIRLNYNLKKIGGFPTATAVGGIFNNPNLEDIGIGFPVATSIESSAFFGTRVKILPPCPLVTTLQDYAFWGANYLERIEDISGVTSIVRKHYQLNSLVYVGFPSKTADEVMSIANYDYFSDINRDDVTYHCSDGDYYYSSSQKRLVLKEVAK